MKICPNCKSEVDDHFELCWNCNYSFEEEPIIELKNDVTASKTGKEVECVRCKILMEPSGKFKFHEGNRIGFLGSIFELFQNRESFDLYHCPKCGKVEFFLSEN